MLLSGLTVTHDATVKGNPPINAQHFSKSISLGRCDRSLAYITLAMAYAKGVVYTAACSIHWVVDILTRKKLRKVT